MIYMYLHEYVYIDRYDVSAGYKEWGKPKKVLLSIFLINIGRKMKTRIYIFRRKPCILNIYACRVIF